MAKEFDINYEDERFQQVEEQKNAALAENEKLYNDAISSADQHYQAQIQASKEWADKQSQLQQEKTDFEVDKIEQQKQQAEKDYQKEQSGAYVDWQKQSNKYGVNAEKMAASGLENSGYSESSEVAMYNAYQNRVATARASYQQAVLNFDNAMREARLQNNSIQAEIAFNALQTQLELTIQGLQYRNQLLLDMANKKLAIDEMFYGRRQDVLAQLNQENALAWQLKQYNDSKKGSGVSTTTPIVDTGSSNNAVLSGSLGGALTGAGAGVWSQLGALVGKGAVTPKVTPSEQDEAKAKIDAILKAFQK